MTSITQRYAHQISGTLSCFDRIVLLGTLPGICYPNGMESYLRSRDVLLIDYPRFAAPFTERLREHVEQVAKDADIKIEFVRTTKNFRKETRVQEVLQQRGVTNGIICILSAMEACPSYKYSFKKETGRNWLQGRNGKCLHYYIYLLHKEFGLCYLRIPTWATGELAVLLQWTQLAGKSTTCPQHCVYSPRQHISVNRGLAESAGLGELVSG